MDVVPLVAIDAARAHRRNLLPRAGMAGHAHDIAVRPIERVVRPFVVIEIPDAPVPRIVAVRACCTQPALVNIFAGMTTRTLLRSILVTQAQVACVTLDHKVPAGERETGTGVIEAGRLP